MARCSEWALCSVLALVALSLQGCGDKVPDCAEPCGEYEAGVTKKTEVVCLDPAEKTKGLSVCSPVYNMNVGTNCKGTLTKCKQPADETDSAPTSSKKEWAELTAEEQAAAVTLGLNQTMWDADTSGPYEDTAWDDLTVKQKLAAGTLGWDKPKWEQLFALHGGPGHFLNIMGVSLFLSMCVVVAVSIRVVVQRRNQRQLGNQPIPIPLIADSQSADSPPLTGNSEQVEKAEMGIAINPVE